MIIDTHSHLGTCRVYEDIATEEELIGAMDENGIDISLVQPFPGAPDPMAVHDQIAELSQKYPGRIFGIASLNPHRDKDEYFKEVSRCVEELGFVGVKLHPAGQAVNPTSQDGGVVFETADELGIAVMVHTGPGIPFSLPSLCIPRARQYPNLNIILAHAGFGILTPGAMVAASECDNIFLETSWCVSEDIRRMINSFSADRVMFGSDLATNIGAELAKYRALNLTKEQLDKCFSQTAEEIFKLNI